MLYLGVFNTFAWHCTQRNREDREKLLEFETTVKDREKLRNLTPRENTNAAFPIYHFGETFDWLISFHRISLLINKPVQHDFALFYHSDSWEKLISSIKHSNTYTHINTADTLCYMFITLQNFSLSKNINECRLECQLVFESASVIFLDNHRQDESASRRSKLEHRWWMEGCVNNVKIWFVNRVLVRREFVHLINERRIT